MLYSEHQHDPLDHNFSFTLKVSTVCSMQMTSKIQFTLYTKQFELVSLDKRELFTYFELLSRLKNKYKDL